MTYDPEWYLRDDHPDAEEHRKFLGIDKKGRPLSAPTPALPPVRLRKAKPRPAIIKRKNDVAIRLHGYALGADLKRILEMSEEAFGQVRKELDAMTARVAELEARPSMQHRGVWRADTQYQAGDVVSQGGSGWVAKAVNKGQKPGDTRLWQLFVKKGKDAR